MTAATDAAQDAESRIRAALEAWARGVPGDPVPDFGRRIKLVSISDRTVYAGFLRCLFDVRSAPVDKLLAPKAGAPPKIIARSDRWALASGLSRQFLEQEETVVAAESAEAMECNACSGEERADSCASCRGAKTVACEACAQRGRKSCPSCRGTGAISCAQCAGSGRVLLSLAQDGSRHEDVCPQCTGKKALPCHECSDAMEPDCAVCANKRVVACAACGGRGAPPCPQCAGARRVLPGFTFTIAYKMAYYRSLVRDAGIPAEIFPEDPPAGKLGETLLALEGAGVADFEGRKPEGAAGEAFSRVLARVPEDGLGPNSRMLLCALSVERVPAYEVAYAFEGKEYRAWVGGPSARVLPSGDPFADLAGRWAARAEDLLAAGDGAAFEDLAARAAAFAPRHPAVAALRGKAAAVSRRAVLELGAKLAAAAAAALPVLLGFCYRSPSRYAPLAALALAVVGLSGGAVYALAARLAARPLLAPRLRDRLTAGAAAAGAASAVLVFLALAPIRRIDFAQFSQKLSRYEASPFETWTADDDASLAALIKDYAARGVDASAGETLQEQRAYFVEAARRKALADAAQRRALAAARAKAEAERLAAAQRAKALAAAKAAAAKKRAAKKKKKPKKTGS